MEICWRGTNTDEPEEGREIEGKFHVFYYTSKRKGGGRFTVISGVKETSFPEAVPSQVKVNGD